MSFIPDQQLDQVRDATDLVQLISEQIPLKKTGRNFKGLCPFHSEKTPSFVVSPEKQIYHCFGCGQGGDAFRFLTEVDGVSFVEAIQLLAERAGIQLQAQRGGKEAETAHTKKLLLRINRLAAEFFFNQLHDEKIGRNARDYLQERKIETETAQRFLLGYAAESSRSLVHHLESKKVPLALAEQVGLIRKGQDGSHYDFFRQRIIFPIRNMRGDFIGFGGRIFGSAKEDVAKYLNSPDSPVYHKRQEVYGLFEAKQTVRQQQRIILCEGYLDVLALAQADFGESVAPLGTALTPEQIRRLRRQVSELYIVFDADAAGIKAAWQALSSTLPAQLPTRIIQLPEGEDPDSFLAKAGKEAFAERVTGAPGLMDYFIKVKGAAAHGDNLAKIAAVREFIPLLASIPGEVEKALYIRGLAEETGLSEQAVAKELRAPATTRRNFPAGRTDVNDAKRQSDSGGVGLTPFEQELLQALCVDGEGAGSLRTEVKGTDWHHPELRELWPRLQKGLGQPQQLAPLLEGVADPQLRKGLAAAMVTELSEETDNESLVSGCHRALRKQRWDVAQKRLTQKIREAEAVSDREKIETLLAEKNRLMKQMHPSQTR